MKKSTGQENVARGGGLCKLNLLSIIRLLAAASVGKRISFLSEFLCQRFFPPLRLVTLRKIYNFHFLLCEICYLSRCVGKESCFYQKSLCPCFFSTFAFCLMAVSVFTLRNTIILFTLLFSFTNKKSLLRQGYKMMCFLLFSYISRWGKYLGVMKRLDIT